MKKTIIFSLFMLGFEVIGYAQNNFAILKVDTVAQKGISSCWVSSTKMLLNYFGDTNLLDTITRLNGYTGNPNSVPVIKFSEYSTKVLTSNKLKINSYSLSRNYAPNSSDYDQQKRSFPKANIIKQDSLPWVQMREALKMGPMILWKEMGLYNEKSHIVVLNGYEHQFSEKHQIRWISVKDPWPVKKASEYLMTYEFYKKKNSSSSPLTLENPRNALFYGFKVNNISTGRVLASNSTAIPSGRINIVTKVSSNTTLMRDSVALQAQKTLNHLLKYSSGNIKSSFGLNQASLNTDSRNIIKLQMVNFLGGGIKTTISVDNSQPCVPAWLAGVSLFDADDTYLVNVKKNNFIAVISMGITQNGELYTTHLEKYGSSTAEIINTVLANLIRPPARNNDITEAYFHRSYDSGLQDFLIVNPNSEKPVLVDLFSKMDEFKNPDKSIKAGVFDLKIHTLAGAKLSQFETYISPITKTCEQNSPVTECPNKVSEAGKIFFQSYKNIISNYHKMILKNPDTLSLLKNAGCGYIIDYFTTSKKDFSRITNGDSISFASSFNYLEAPNYKNMFITPLIDDSYYIFGSGKYVNTKPDSSIPSLRYANQAYNSESCFPFPKQFKFSAFGYRQDSLFVQTIFVPVITYKLLQNKKFDDSDFEYLQNYAVNPKEIMDLDNPLIESNEGYLSTINTTLKQNCNEQKSITGVVCDLKLKNNQTVQCYVFNRESFGKSNPFINWKVKK